MSRRYLTPSRPSLRVLMLSVSTKQSITCKKCLCFLILFLSFFPDHTFAQPATQPYVLILGIAQDGGYPQAGCNKLCCKDVREGKEPKRHVSCLALIDPSSKQSWLFDCTPDFGEQLQMLRDHMKDSTHFPSGIFLTHAHIGHYAGLMQLGKEVMGCSNVPVYAMPRMSAFLNTNGPWSQLVSQKNISLQKLEDMKEVMLSPGLSVKPMRVPHRDEYSETVGYEIRFSGKKVLFIPDIDKWEKWEYSRKVFPSLGSDSVSFSLCSLFRQYDYLLIDATFYKAGELPGKNMSSIPHPFVTESMKLLDPLKKEERARIFFIHFNHSNPLLKNGFAYRESTEAGFGVAREGMILK